MITPAFGHFGITTLRRRISQFGFGECSVKGFAIVLNDFHKVLTFEDISMREWQDRKRIQKQGRKVLDY